MAKLFSFASWNVEHFHGKPERTERVADFVIDKDPDVFGIYEVQGKDVFDQFMNHMPSHSFFITENKSRGNMEILVGVRRNLQSFITQRNEFQSKVPTLRPGALATLRIAGENYSVLFLHVKSAGDPRSWGLRDDMFFHVARLKGKLDKMADDGKQANFLCLGDLNTMGLNATYNNISDLTADQELEFVEKRFKAKDMRRLPKTHEETWWNGKNNWEPSKLDHVFAAEHLKFKKFEQSEINVLGWPEESTKTKKRAWINGFSDHALLYGEVHS